MSVVEANHGGNFGARPARNTSGCGTDSRRCRVDSAFHREALFERFHCTVDLVTGPAGVSFEIGRIVGGLRSGIHDVFLVKTSLSFDNERVVRVGRNDAGRARLPASTAAIPITLMMAPTTNAAAQAGMT